MPPSHKILTPRICLQCGKSFEATPCQIRHGRGKHCSRACQYMTVAKLNSQRTKGTIREGSWEDRTCPVCGKVFRKKKGYKTIHCSRLCAHQNPQSRRHISESLKSSERAKSARVGGIQRMNAAMPTDRRSALVKTAWQRPEIRQRIMEGIQRRSASAEWRSAPQFQKGNQHPRYKGNRKARDGSSRYEYKSWRTSVYKCDNFTCQKCFAHGVPLAAHHIFSWAEYPALRYEQSNGITLCEDCHDKIHGKSKKPKTFACIDCGIKKTSGRSPRCYSCGAKARWLKK